jgi:RNA polymerase sigma-70 factor (ECF subfamily)
LREEEFARLVIAWAPRAAALARAIAGSADADDVAQEAVIRAWRSIRTLADEARFGPWLLAIARNLAKNRVRDRAIEARVPPPPSPPREADFDRVRAAVDALPAEQREVVRLRYEAGMAYEEIAAALDLGIDLVRSRLHEAKEKLRSILG